MRTRAVIPALALAGALVATVGASARPQATTIQIRTVMNAAQEVPSPTGAVSDARGTFSATVTKSDTGASVSWQLSFNGLTANAIAAHIHTGAVGSPGPVVLALCGPCTSPASGTGAADPGRARCDPGRHGVCEHPHADEPGGRDSWPAGNDREHLDETSRRGRRSRSRRATSSVPPEALRHCFGSPGRLGRSRGGSGSRG